MRSIKDKLTTTLDHHYIVRHHVNWELSIILALLREIVYLAHVLYQQLQLENQKLFGLILNVKKIFLRFKKSQNMYSGPK